MRKRESERDSPLQSTRWNITDLRNIWQKPNGRNLCQFLPGLFTFRFLIRQRNGQISKLLKSQEKCKYFVLSSSECGLSNLVKHAKQTRHSRICYISGQFIVAKVLKALLIDYDLKILFGLCSITSFKLSSKMTDNDVSLGIKYAIASKTANACIGRLLFSSDIERPTYHATEVC